MATPTTLLSVLAVAALLPLASAHITQNRLYSNDM